MFILGEILPLFQNFESTLANSVAIGQIIVLLPNHMITLIIINTNNDNNNKEKTLDNGIKSISANENNTMSSKNRIVPDTVSQNLR